MTPEIVLIFMILAVAIILLVTEWIPMEVTALLSLGAVAVTGLVRPVDALAGFSNPAVITIWAVFILSGGLTLTGVANIIGGFVRRLAGRNEIRMIVVIMTSAGVMSAVMNNVAVAALMLPVVIGLSRHTETPPSRLLMPLAYGSLLGGLTTQIGTPPNILVTDALRDHGLTPFSFFDFTPIGLLIMISGIVFMALIGRHLLPRRDVVLEFSDRKQDYGAPYDIQSRLFFVRIPQDSPLAGKTLADSRLRSALGLNAIGITRSDRAILNPGPSDRLKAGDILTVEGRMENFLEINDWNQLIVEAEPVDARMLATGDIGIGECRLTERSDFVGETLVSLDFQNRFGAMVLAIRREKTFVDADFQHSPLKDGDVLVVQGRREDLEKLKAHAGLDRFREIAAAELADRYELHDRLMAMRISEDSGLIGKSLKQSRLGKAVNIRVLSIARPDGTITAPTPGEILNADDRLIVGCRKDDLKILGGLKGLQIERRGTPKLDKLANGRSGLVEAILSPHTTLAGATLRQLNFRAKYGLNVLSVWREGSPIFSDLPDLPLRFGDALLLFGSRKQLHMLNREPDFIVLQETVQEITHPGKAKVSTVIMVAVLLPVFLGWIPIYISAVIGAALMVMTKCLTMEEAYRQIEWKAVFLIAGMLPLGTALDQTGAARMIAEGVVGLVGPFGPRAVMFGLMGLTFLATCFIPTAALVVLMAPIAFSTAANMGLSPYGLLMSVAMAASASFMTPISHPANILVMGPGGYRFIDYLKSGGPMTLVVLVVLMIMMPFFWPLQP